MKGLARALQAYNDETIEKVQRGVAETAVLLDTEASSRIPVDTSFAKQMIGYSIDSDGLGATVESGAEYSVYLEFGTGIYAEGPGGSRAKKIPWVYKNLDGEYVTTYGNPAQPFWFPSIDVAQKYFKNYFS